LAVLLGAAFSSAQDVASTPAEAFYRQGMIDLRAGRVVDGETRLLQALRADRSHFLAHLALAELYQSSDPELALAHLNVASQLRPSSDQVHFLIGQHQERLGRLLDAAEQYRRAITLNARHADADRRLKSILRTLRERKSVLERASEQFWRKPSLGALTLYGRVVSQESTPLQALLEFESIRDKLPELPEVNLWIARTQRLLGSAEGELDAYRRYLETSSGAHQVRLTLVERLLELGKYEDANLTLAPLAKVAEQDGAVSDPEVPARATFLLSRVWVGKGDPAGASALLLRAANLGFDPARVGDAFEDDLARYPDLAAPRMAQGKWLRGRGKDAEAAQAYHHAGMLDTTQRPAAGTALQELLAQGRAANEALLGLGDFAVSESRDAEAERLLGRVAASHPASRRASLLLTVLARRRGDLSTSLDRALRYVLSFPDRAGMAFARGNLFWELGQPDVAEAMWGEDPGVAVRYPEALVHLADWYGTKKNAPAELTARELLRELEPSRVANRRRLGELYNDAGRVAEAVTEWESVIRLSPGDGELRLRLARAEIALGRRASAIEHLLEAGRIGPLPDPLTDMLARELTAQRRYAEAISVYWKIYQARPDQPDLARVMPLLALQVPAAPEVRVAGARVAEKQGRTDQAMEILEDVVRRDAGQTEARLMLAGMYLQLNDPKEAERILSPEGGAALTDVQRLSLLAEALTRQNRKEEAAAALTRLRELSPADAVAQRRLAFLLYDLARHEEALALLEPLAKAGPADPELSMRAARSALALGKDDVAITHLTAWVEASPENESALQLLIERVLKAQRWKDAAPRLERWVVLHPDDNSSRYNLVVTYLRLNQREAGRPHYDVLVSRNAAQAGKLASFYK
jgi:tetratricopeptide (TPR) repeat protein